MKRYETKTSLILFFLEGAKKYFLLSAVFATLVSLLDMLSPKIISFTVDAVLGGEEVSLAAPVAALLERIGGIEVVRAHTIWVAACVAVVGALAALCRYLFRVCNARGAELFVERIRNQLFSHILRLPYTWIGENSTGDIIQRCTSDVQTIKRFISEQLTALVRTIILIALSLAFMAGIDLRVTLLSAAFIPIVVGYSLFFHSRIGSAFEKADIEEGKLSAIAQENLTGVRVVRAFGREIYEQERFESQNTYYTNYWIRLIRLLSAFWTSGDILTELQILSVLLLGAHFCVKGSLTAGGYIALVSYTLMLIQPVRMLGRVISEMSKAGVSIDRLAHIMNAEPETDRPNSLCPPLDQEIVFDHVSFSYEENGPRILDDVSFRIPAGSTVGILGGTGSGKSTLMYLLERLYTLAPNRGRITIGGVDLTDISLGHLRQNIGMVLQEPFLFSRSLAENISIAADSTHQDLASVRRAARIAVIDDVIMDFTEGYDTFVGERGVTLSGGQKQRTAMAQTLIRQAPLMIFDDSLSAVDAETDRKIRLSLRENTGRATVILISHRITTLMHADQILVLDKGKLVEEGNHRSLYEQGGLYRRIFDLQSAGAEDIL